MNTLNERIKQLRKEKGLTQSQLAEMVCVSDKAVSKWEVGETNPDISMLPELAKIFDVSIDYLLTGKIEETISLDDMDFEKRALYLIKKDDVENFKKYGYLKHNLILNDSPYYASQLNRTEEKMISAIYESDSLKIFTECLNLSLSQNDCVRNNIPGSALMVNKDLDKYIRLCCKSGTIEGLKFIGLKYFAISNKTSTSSPIRFYMGPTSLSTEYGSLSKETLDYIFSSKEVPSTIKTYLSEIEFYSNGKNVYIMTDQIISELYENGLFEKLQNSIEQMREYNKKESLIYNESLNGGWYTGKRIDRNAIYFTNNGDQYLRGLVNPIITAASSAQRKKDFKWLRIFNDYNKNLKELFPKMDVYVLNDNEIKLMELENDKNTPFEDLLNAKFIDGEYLNINGLLNGEYGLTKEDIVARCKEKISQIKDLDKFINEHYLCALELILDCLDKGNNKKIFKLATDLGYSELQNAIIDGNKKLVKEITFKLFVPTEDVFNRIESYKKTCFNFGYSSDREVDIDRVKNEREKQFNDMVMNEQSKFIEKKENEFRNVLNREYYSKMLKKQFVILPLNLTYKEISIDTFKDLKKQMINDAIKKCEDRIESITNEKAMLREYEKISKDLSREYLYSELQKGEADKVVVLICKRLQIILEYKYRYTGDLFTMIDTLIDNKMQLHNCHDDEDNNYLRYKREDEVSSKRIQLLHKLRMKRNTIVHAERKEVEISIEEIKECIELLDLLSE